VNRDNLSINTNGAIIKTAGQIVPVLALLIPSLSFAEPHSIYGDLRYSLNNVNVTSSNLRTENNASRLGVKGSFDVSPAVSFIYHAETGLNIDSNANVLSERFYYGGIKGSLGKLVYGRISTPYKMAGLKVDPFYDTSVGAGFAGATFGLSGLTNGWSDNALSFSSAAYGDFSFNAGLYVDDSDYSNHDTNVGFTFANKNVTAGLQYLDIDETGLVANSSPDSSAVRGHIKYTVGAWSIAASLENIDVDSGSDQEYIYISTTYQLSEKLKLAASLGSVSKVSDSKDGDAINLGAFYQIFKKTNISFLFSQVDFDKRDNRNTVAIALSHKFSWTKE